MHHDHGAAAADDDGVENHDADDKTCLQSAWELLHALAQIGAERRPRWNGNMIVIMIWMFHRKTKPNLL